MPRFAKVGEIAERFRVSVDGSGRARFQRTAWSASRVLSASWHDLRRTFATLADLEKISIGERKQLMGHGRAEMTPHYTHVPSEQVSEVLERLSEKIVEGAHLRSERKKVVRMKTAVAR
jgi:integrase